MKKLCFLLLITCFLAGNLMALEVKISAIQSCRTDRNNPDGNNHDSHKLSVRGDASSAKSWMKFDISELEPNDIRAASLRVALHKEKSGGQDFQITSVNDDVLDNIAWVDHPTAEDPGSGIYALTWNNAPANDTASYTSLIASQSNVLETVSFSNGVRGTQFTVDALSAVAADTDGIVQFALNNSSGLMEFCTHDHSGTLHTDSTLGGPATIDPEEAWPTLIITLPPLGADYPDPEIDETVTTSLPQLSWVNPDPNYAGDTITCTVYLGIEPNRLGDMDSVILDPDDNSVLINTANFETYGDLQDLQTYYWFVDCTDDGTSEEIPGEEWSFETYDNQPPTVDAGEDQVTWLSNDPNTITLIGTADDDGGAPAVSWEETAGPGTSVIASPDQLTTVVSFVDAGDYTFTLTADDGELQTSDTVRVVVGNGPCDATHVFYETDYNDADVNEDCLVDLADFMELIAEDWLNCTNVLTGC